VSATPGARGLSCVYRPPAGCAEPLLVECVNRSWRCPAPSATSLCHVFWALAVILLAFAGFTVIVVKVRRPAPTGDESGQAVDSADSGRRIDLEQLKGFVYVGAAALALLALAVILMGLFANRNGRAEGLAVLGFFGYAAYLVAATAVLYVMSRKG
jgi:hypothetical protein